MPKLRSLRAKMLALILVPVLVALAATTLLAISRASSAQQEAAYAELDQRTDVESAEGQRDRRRGACRRPAPPRRSSRRATAAPTPLDGMAALLSDAHQERHGRLLGPRAQRLRRHGRRSAGLPGTDSDALPAERALSEKGIAVAASPDGAKAALAFVKQPVSGVMEPTAYQGTMYVTYQVPVKRDGKVVGFAGTANTLAGVDARISQDQALRLAATRSRSRPRACCSPARTRRTTARSASPSSPSKQPGARAGRRSRSPPARTARSRPPTRGRARRSCSRGRRSTPSGWSFLTAAPVDEVLAPVKSLQSTLFLVGVIALILLALMIVLVANKLTKPIRTVTEAAERVSQRRGRRRRSTSSPTTRSAAWPPRSSRRSSTCARRPSRPRPSPAAT